MMKGIALLPPEAIPVVAGPASPPLELIGVGPGVGVDGAEAVPAAAAGRLAFACSESKAP